MDGQCREEMRREVLDRISRQGSLTDEEVLREIDQVVLRRGKAGYDSLDSMGYLRQETFDAIRRFGILEKYLRDDRITEIMITGARKIFVEKDGVIFKTEDTFADPEELGRLVDQIVAPTNRIVNEARPIADSRLPDGSRVHIVLPPVSLDGPVITIRKFQRGGMTMKKLINYGEFPKALAPILETFVRSRYSILISGATNSGKSSLLNALGEYIGKKERIITIEDSAELKLIHVENLVRLETRDSNAEGMNAISMKELIKASLRMRPDRIIVGEVRGEEALWMLQAMSTGHSGSFSSIHGNSCRDALRRLETMVLMGMDMPLKAIQGLIASAIDILIHLGRLPGGERRLIEISELKGFRDGDYDLNPLFSLDYSEDKLTYEEDNGDFRKLSCVGTMSSRQKMVEEGMLQQYETALEEYQSL